MALLGDIDPDAFNITDLAAADFQHHMAVPGVYDTQSGREGMRGLVALRTRVTVTPGTRGLIRCGGIGLWARAFVDGIACGECHLPYSAWEISVPASDRQERDLVVLLDNRFGPERALLFDDYFDWYAHGGIYRAMFWHELPAAAFDRIGITPLSVEHGEVALEVRLRDCPATVDLAIAWDDGPENIFRNVPVNNGLARLTSIIPQARAWTPATPHLHELRCRFVDGSDAIRERCGLRTLATSGEAIMLNGEPLHLRGVNRHELQPQTGPAMSDAQILHDLSVLQDLGVNFVRGSHYQQDQRFLDLCDECGILVWEESLGWQARDRHFTNPRFLALHEQQVRTMVRTSINHPAIFCWGILNEGDSFEASSEPVYQQLAAAIRDEDASRLLTYACNHPFTCRNFDLCDIISVNQYPGWYAEDPSQPRPLADIAEQLNRVLAALDEAGQGSKPKIISEIGAGAIYGWRDQFASHWSEEYQADYLSTLCDYFAKEARWIGLAIWQFCDGRTKNGGYALVRPRAFNNKGLLDEYRRPKMAYQVVREAYRQQAESTDG